MSQTNATPRQTPAVIRQASHSHLVRFKEAKQEIIRIYESILEFMNECHSFTGEQMKEEKFARIIGENTHEEVETQVQKIRGIQNVISRNQMKCAFFGRTSNGKSTVINAMLGCRLLPSGIGHTTNCFLQIQGTDQPQGYFVAPEHQAEGSNETDKPRDQTQGDQYGATHQSQLVDTVGQLAHSLSGVKLTPDSLISIYWPSSKCRLLREDVVLLDSPGINVDPDTDKWIDSHCLDADVFVLVANAESTLMQAEKHFFHQVSQRLSKPNIFILNNRWDASANETDYIKEVREQHLQRCVAFLVDELKVCTRAEAEEHVFFVSAREALMKRVSGQSEFGAGPPGTVDSIGSPIPQMPYMAEGWQERLEEFRDFEVTFEKNLSESATRTKFAAHCEQGKQILERFRSVMETIYETTVEEKDAAVRCRTLSQAHLEEVRSRLNRTNQLIEEMIQTCLTRVEAQVANALNAEIRRLGELVESFNRPFHPDQAMLSLYKRELSTHVERELGRKLAAACSSDILNEVSRSEQIMMSKLAAIVSDEAKKNRILQLVDPISFQPEFHVDCRNLCADFREDIQFRFSLGLSTLFHKFTMVGRSSRPHTWSAVSGSSLSHDGSILRSGISPWTIDLFPSLLSRNAVGAVIVFGLVSKAVGWRVLGVIASLYGGLYLYERLAWTNKAKEAAFKRQYVEFASNKLRLIVDLTSTNARHQVKRELQVAQKRLSTEVDSFASAIVEEVKQLDADIIHLDAITAESKKLKNRASVLTGCLTKFYDVFIANVWHE